MQWFQNGETGSVFQFRSLLSLSGQIIVVGLASWREPSCKNKSEEQHGLWQHYCYVVDLVQYLGKVFHG